MTIGLQRPLKIPPPSTSRTNIQGCLVPLPESILESSKGLTRTGFLICAGKTALRGFLRLIQNVTGPYSVPGRPEYHSCAWGASVLSLHKLTLSYVTPYLISKSPACHQHTRSCPPQEAMSWYLCSSSG